MPGSSANFADRLRVARELRGLSQTELAERAGLQASAISHFESARRAPSLDNLRRLGEALRVTTDYLLGRVESPTEFCKAAGTLFRKYEEMKREDQEQIDRYAEFLSNEREREEREKK